jgi:hypothetical protein
MGTYAGELAGLGGTDASVVTVDALGVVAGTTSSNCTYFGLALPRSRGNVYDLSLTFRTGCANAGSTLRGHAFLRALCPFEWSLTSSSVGDSPSGQGYCWDEG